MRVDPPGGRVNFGRTGRSVRGPKVRVMAAILSVVSLATWAVQRHLQSPMDPVVGPDEVVIEVRGSVTHPGFLPVKASSSVSDVVTLAGGRLTVPDERRVEAGTSIWVEEGRARLGVMENTLVVGVPLDINRASRTALTALPGVGESRADAIVTDREQNGPFGSVDELVRVRGIGPATLTELRPFLTVQP